ncbi:TIM barrel protein [Chelativorans sp. AA-79]|uniref:sugar phosphate isomerase/epimerase family protein n=1 Tax=Chelativorans sp. AA-79 TaxID=3028735 RepID=UPI0023F7809C|nr:TIM barrel protein [Chelativorans sp. AA-79]WEX08101.1 TIM barrel protein [Chelativorans sp. AA-79]
MYLSVTSWSFPSLTLEEAAGVSRVLGINALDVSTKRRPGLDKAEILGDPDAAAERVLALRVKVPNYYHHFGESLPERNLALPGTIDANARDLERVLAFADAAGIPTVFFLPGIVNPGQSRQQALDVAVQSLKVLLEVQKSFKAEICVEPIVRSFAESPAIVAELVERTGIRLALDYSHFLCLGYTQEQIDPLCAHAAHVHLRQARMGDLQAKFAKGTINFPALFATLETAGYAGALAIEYVYQDFMNAYSDDVMTETVAMRDCFNEWNAARSA